MTDILYKSGTAEENFVSCESIRDEVFCHIDNESDRTKVMFCGK